MKVVVIGGTGLIGSKLVERLRELGEEAVAASPDSGVDTQTGEGLAEVLDGAAVVVDVSNSPSFETEAAMAFFRDGTRNLLAAEAATGVGHHVALSVVGTDRLQEMGYFEAKAAQEEMIAASGVPYTIVHATQFFEFLGRIADASTQDGLVRLPPVLFQPMASADVAAALARVATAAPINGIVETAGPERSRLDEVVRAELEARGDARQVVTDPAAKYFGAVTVSEAALVPEDGASLGTIRLEEWRRASLTPS